MKIVVVNYGGDDFNNFQKLNTKLALKYGKVDEVLSYLPNDIDPIFYNNNKSILSQARGGGYWLWKPYIIKKALDSLEWGDVIIYLDSGSCYPYRSIRPFISKLLSDENWWIHATLQQGFSEKEWTKRDAFILMSCDYPEYTDSEQYWAGQIIIKKCKKSMQFLDEWISYCSDPRIITDTPNTCNIDNYDIFKEHRHDQSIYSLLCKKYNVKPGEYINLMLIKLKNYIKWDNAENRIICYIHHIKRNKILRSIKFHICIILLSLLHHKYKDT